MKRWIASALFACACACACTPGPKKTCKVNDQCFVCPDDKAVSKCMADPTTSRCKWTPPSDCK